ncbi:hypothetical protein NHQ30_007166 [Ciborinia camelliae]|nr:hypothetical protein NHQ30_007166 [Ciborinia camelliae]
MVESVAPRLSSPGIDTLPILLAQTIFVIRGGIFVSVTGYYVPLMWILASVAAGLLTTLAVNSSPDKWIGYQIIYGIGGGLGSQQGSTAAHTVLNLADIAIGTAVMVFVQNFGDTIFISAANNVFVTSLVKNLVTVVPDLNPQITTSASATGIKQVVRPEEYPLVLIIYNGALIEVFKRALLLAYVCAIGAAGMEWKRGQTSKGKPKNEGAIEESQSNDAEMSASQMAVS